MLKTVYVAARDRKRLQQIAGVLVRFGFGDLVARLRLGRLLDRAGLPGGSTDPALRGVSAPARLRLAIEALGPTFVKLGQILATRADLLPPDWIAELERLHDRVPPLAYDEIAPQITADLGAPPEEVFATFTRSPLAAASIAQVHRATLADGRPVVVKVRRPGLRETVEADLRLLAHAAEIAEAELPELRRYRPREMMRHLAAAISEELDLANEGRNAELLAESLAARPDIRVPAIHWRWSGERLLVQDYVEGIRPSETAALDAAGLDRHRLAARLAEAVLEMILLDGLFHADPHPGNLLCLPGDTIALLDFGTVGRVSARRREQLVALMGALAGGNPAAIAEVLIAWSGRADVDAAALEDAAADFLARHLKGSLQQMRLGEALGDFVALARDHDLVLPADLALLFKALITAEGVVRRLDPDYDILAGIGPIVQRALSSRYAPEALLRRAGAELLDLRTLLADLPATLRALQRRLQQGRLGAHVEIAGFERLGASIERAAGRIALGLVIAAFVLGLAPALRAAGPVWHGVPLGLALGLLAALTGLLWLLLPRRPK